jgi:hypothetical membrane protein
MSDTTTPRADAPSASGVHARGKVTQALLAGGIAAGPIYVAVGLVQMLIRDGFDIRRHPLSLMSNGDLGWIQVVNFLLTGTLTVLAAVGMRRALSPGRGATWGSLLVGVYGTGVFLAGLFAADPVDGFPPGTPLGPPEQVSWHGLVHFLVAGIGFVALAAACLVMSRRFAADGQRGWAAYSVVTGVVFLAGFLGVAAGSAVVNVLFALAIVNVCAWVAGVSALLRARLAEA